MTFVITDQLLSFSAWHCWLGHPTHKIVPNMTYNVFGGTLNPTLQLPCDYIQWHCSS